MKSFSNVIEATTSNVIAQNWLPFDFGSGAVSPDVEDGAAKVDPFEELSPPQIDWKEAGDNPVAQPAEVPVQAAQAPDPQPVSQPQPGSAARKWLPAEVRPYHPEIQEKPVERLVEAPSLEEARARLINEALVEASKLLQSAQVQAVELVRSSEERAQQIALQAQQQGWDTAKAETIPLLQTVTEMAAQVQSWSEDMYAQSQNAVFTLVQEIARTLFCEGFALDSDMLQQTFNRILSNARSLGDLRIYVNPDDAITLGPYWREYQVSLSGQQIEIIPSESIQRGGCFVDGHQGTVDGRIETQYNAIMEVLSSSVEGQTK